ncbi:hypothetical protein OH76DRAFT_965562 [Lentinus brumalis]|uniref:DUF6534 domain-containing protein n=1 Tax=Lentinus brumalis TaxID=2498619 RepID=A0A371DPL4_9APHY|nr:hypothetical protein OH76DRAFT_965562 [Polyporus brumalis]
MTIALHNTLGAAFIGNVLAACLYGLTSLQAYIYFNRSHKDSVVLKTLVAILWFLDAIHLAFVSHAVYEFCVTDFGDLLALLEPTWYATVIVTGVSDGILRGIFCYRIWILGNEHIPTLLVLASSSLLSVGCALAFPILGFRYKTFVGLEKIGWVLYLGLSTGVSSDLLISAALCVLLARRRSSFQRVRGVVRNLIWYSINTCLLTTACSLAALIAYAASPHTFIYITFYFLLPKLFLNSLLATLNARKSLGDQIVSKDGVQIPLSSRSISGESCAPRALEGDRHAQFPRNASQHDFKGLAVA